MVDDLFDSEDMTGLAAAVSRGEVDPDALLDAALARTDRVNTILNAVVLRFDKTARQQISTGLPDGPFKGVPFLLKDLGAEARDFPSHNGSRLLMNTVYAKNSAIYERLAATGLVVFGRTASPEGGVGAATEAAVYGGPTSTASHVAFKDLRGLAHHVVPNDAYWGFPLYHFHSWSC